MRVLLIVFFVAFGSACIVFEAPEPDPEPEPEPRLQCGAVVVPCGCHGYVNPGARFQERDCETGWAEAVPCYNVGYCAGGTLPWGLRCTC